MNKPVAIERAQAGRTMFFPNFDWEPLIHFESQTLFRSSATQSDGQARDSCAEAVSMSRGRMILTSDKKKRLHLKFRMAFVKAGLVLSIPVWVNRRRERVLITLTMKNSVLSLEVIRSNGSIKSSASSHFEIDPQDPWNDIEIHVDNNEAILTINRQVEGTVHLPRRSRLSGQVILGDAAVEWEPILPSKSFQGCIKSVKMNGFLQDLRDYVKTKPCHIFCV